MLLATLIVATSAQTTTQDVTRATAGLVFLLQAPGNCLAVVADLPPNPPSSNMAALWIRAAFHDAGTYDPTDLSGGADASVAHYRDAPENAGLDGSLGSKFLPNLNVKLSSADAIQLAAVVAITHCILG